MPRGFLVKRYGKPVAVRRYSDEDRSDTSSDHETGDVLSPLSQSEPLALYISESVSTTPPRLSSPPSTPQCPSKKRSTTQDNERKVKATKKHKVTKRLNFDEDKTSPVSGTFIRDPDSDDDLPAAVRRGDIDPSLNVVVVTEEARAELAKIENKIGDYVCQLCKDHFQDAFGLAQHRCSRIVHVEYRCPECDKVFNCPANLASHRRWHKPRPLSSNAGKVPQPSRLLPSNLSESFKPPPGDLSDSDSIRDSPSPNEDTNLPCDVCGKKFRRLSYLKKHLVSHSDLKEGTYVCHCGQTFNNLADRTNHALLHSGVLQNSDQPNSTDNCDLYQCKYCTSTFYSSPGLTRHINKYHPSENRQVILLQVPSVRTASS
ncbi:insulinoma-associated protein 1a-like [Centruroides vittatus]|uniref:insulinoma-associated protein 1a-like n=1 Tax=Centruroides sculpturatus TaxID=218467 RepID=UPI000C6CAB49|nr:insulinoma-associated protein 1a-like [Centruroides sculpturatus]